MPDHPKILIVRCDASVAMGTGHVMRCLALAQAWQDAGGEVVFAMAEAPDRLKARLVAEKMQVVQLDAAPGSDADAAQVSAVAREHAANWVVVDGYHFGAAYQRQLKASGFRVLFVDDNGHAGHYSADLVLNQNAHADESYYTDREQNTQLLLGYGYVLLRREFALWRDWKRQIAPAGHKVLVTMGGSDPDNVTARVLEVMETGALAGLEIVVVVGGGNPHFAFLERLVDRSSGKIRLLSDVSNIPELMAWADVGILAAGTTCWEMCVLGLPAILLALAENQQPIGRELDRRKIAIYLGDADEVTGSAIAGTLQNLLKSGEERAAMSRRARELVDAYGANRVVFSMQSVDFRLRRVEEKDCRLLWEWANDPVVRAVSFSPEAISWEQHLDWFRAQLQNADSLLYLIKNMNEAPVAQVRYQMKGARAMVSISVGPEFRGRGLGGVALHMATEELLRCTKVSVIDAYVKPENSASLRLFTRSGFVQRATVQVRGQDAIHFELTRNGAS